MAVSRDGVGFVDASQLLELSRSLKGVKDARKFRAAVGNANREVIEVVAAAARSNASGNRQAAAVADDPSAMKVTGNPDKASIALVETPYGGDRHDPRHFAFGAEFGAYKDVVRTIGVRRLATGSTTRTSKSGKSYTRTSYAADYRQASTIIGWNQFRKWGGSGTTNAEGVGRSANDPEPGYFLWPAVRDTGPEAARLYGERASAVLQSALAAPFVGGI